MARIPTFALVALLLIAPLTGCIAGETGQEQTPASQDAPPTNSTEDATNATGQGTTNATDPAPVNTSADTPAAPEPEPTPTALSFAPAQDPVEVTLWRNATFAPNDTALPTGVLLEQATGQAPHRHAVALAEHLIGDVPAVVRATVTYQATEPNRSLHGSQLDLRVEGGDGERYRADQAQSPAPPPGETGQVTTWANATFVPDGTEGWRVVVEAAYPSSGEGVAYQLRVDVSSHPDRLVPGVPVTAELDPSTQPVTATPAPGVGPTQVRVWDPNDAHLGTYTVDEQAGHLGLPTHRGPGAYVLLVLGDHPGIELSVPGTPEGGLAALGLATTLFPGTEVQAPEAPGEPFRGESTFHVPTRPLAVGAYLAGGQTGAANATMRANGTLTLTGPAGTLGQLDETVEACLCPGVDGAWRTPIGAQEARAGTYTASYEATAQHGSQVGGFVVTYQR